MLRKLPSGHERSPQAQPLSLEECLAKTVVTPEGEVLPGRTVTDHCLIVGEIARALTKRLPPWLLEKLFPKGSELIAASHDLGKVSPTFQKKIHKALSHGNEKILSALKSFNPDTEKLWGGHAGISQLAVEACGAGRYIPEIVGKHHGRSPNVALHQAVSNIFGGPPWQAQRCDLLNYLKERLGVDYPMLENDLQANVLAGLTTVADWIGSGWVFENPEEDWQDKIELALDQAGFIPATVKSGLDFTDIFGFPAKPTQQAFIDATTGPGVYILEAPMGLGKTEAALYASYKLVVNGLATGIYFALPTQLTSDRIHDRVNDFLCKILDEPSPHKQAILVHGKAWLRQFEMGEEGNPGGSWFSQGKRGILAPFAVGTVDQALMAVMNVKHGFVRTFGLAGKVVILDEVHSYDAFTGTIIDALVKALRSLHCTVIILSATLTQKRRSTLLRELPHKDAYPLVTAEPAGGARMEIAPELLTDAEVTIAHPADDDAMEEALKRAEEGQQVLWIENTVQEAQSVYLKLAARAREIEVACGLLHSRFTKADRDANESNWVSLFGKDGFQQRAKQGRILVGTQVLEQSLDIDADFLVTRIAPTDMLLQRLGRLWRHAQTPRPAGARREVAILAPVLEEAISAPEKNFGPTAKVYAPYVLCRSLELWQNLTRVHIPSQIRDLIEETYRERTNEGEDMLKQLHQLKKQREKLQSLALLGLSRGGKTLPEEKAQTRYSEQDSTEVLLIRSFRQDQEKKGAWVTLLNGEKILVPYSGRSLARRKWREVTATLMQHTVTVADYLAPNPVGKSLLRWLQDYFYLGRPEDDESTLLRVGLVDESGEIRAIARGTVNDRYRLFYDDRLGYCACKEGKV